jgi:hypothetical protein
MTKFLFAINGASAPQQNALTEFIRAKGWQLWHWFNDIWLVTGIPEETSIEILRDEIYEIPTIKGCYLLIMKFRGDISYSGWANPEGWPWMKENWGTPNGP